MIERVYLLFEIISIILVLWILHGSRKRPGICTIIYVCLELIIVSLIGEGWLSNYYFSLAYLGLVVVDIFEFNDNFKNSIIYIVTDYFLIFCCQLIGAVIFAIVNHTEKIPVNGAILINATVLIILLLSFIKFRLHNFFANFLEKGKITNFILSILGIVLVIMLKKQITQLRFDWDLVVYAILFFAIILLVVLKLERERMENIQYLEELKQYQQYNVVYKDIISEIRHRQHDFNNHLQALYSMSAACDNLDQLRKEEEEYLKELEKNNKTYHLLNENVSSLLVAFLYVKFKGMQEKDICIDYTINIKNVEKIIPFSSMVELVGNLLDNAVEAVLKDENKKIWFLMEENQDVFHFKISNPYKWDDVNLKRFEIKDGKSEKGAGHGYGLTNVKRIIGNYRGMLQIEFSIEEDIKVIVFDIILPLKKEVS